MSWNRLRCYREEHYFLVELNGEKREYNVDFDVTCDEQHHHGSYFEQPWTDRRNLRTHIGKVEEWQGWEVTRYDIDDLDPEWQEAILEAVENYALENLEE